MKLLPRIVSIGTANPGRRYTQAELVSLFGAAMDRRIAMLFKNSHIESRFLCLPEPGPDGKIPTETPLQLAQKHRTNALWAGAKAIGAALEPAGLKPSDVDSFVCVTSTGFLCPSLTAWFIKELGFRADVHRADIVGMGCNGGLNGLQPVVNYCALNPQGVGLLLCVEVCTAAYVFDNTIRTAVVNSLFGDGAAAAVIATRDQAPGPKIHGFSSHIITDAIGAMRFDFDGEKQSFFLDRDIPYILGQNVDKPVDKLLGKFGLKRRDIKHWVIHSGGRKVIDSIKYCLNITAHDVRHTDGVLRDYGNLSSGSFLFSHKRLIDEGVAKPGEHIMMMTMGPGSTVECCLGEF